MWKYELGVQWNTQGVWFDLLLELMYFINRKIVNDGFENLMGYMRIPQVILIMESVGYTRMS